MNTSSTRKFQRRYLAVIAAIALTGSGLVGSSASAKTDTIGGGHALTHRSSPVARGFSAPLRIFDEGDYVAARKVAMAQYRIDHALLYL